MPESALESVLSGLGSGLLWAGAIALWWALFAIIALAVADPRVQPTRDTDRQRSDDRRRSPTSTEPSLTILVPRELAKRMHRLSGRLQADHNRGYLRLPHQYRQHVPTHYIIELGVNELEGHWDDRFRKPTHGRPVHQATPAIPQAQERSLSPATPRE
jgi:hypothetical protein